MPPGQGVHAAVAAPPTLYAPIGHGVAAPPPTTPRLVDDPARQKYPGSQAPLPVAAVAPAPHHEPAAHGPVHVAAVCPAAEP